MAKKKVGCEKYFDISLAASNRCNKQKQQEQN